MSENIKESLDQAKNALKMFQKSLDLAKQAINNGMKKATEQAKQEGKEADIARVTQEINILLGKATKGEDISQQIERITKKYK